MPTRCAWPTATLAVAQAAAARVNTLLGVDRATALELDVTDNTAVETALRGVDAFLSAVPYYLNLDIARAAVRAGASMCDLGGNTDLVREQLALDADARAAGISLVPDCGQVPGMGTTLMVYAMSLLDEPEEVFMWDGGLPQDPRPPFNYLLTFNVAGLTNEYAEPPVFLRNGVPTLVEPMAELEEIDFPPPVGPPGSLHHRRRRLDHALDLRGPAQDDPEQDRPLPRAFCPVAGLLRPRPLAHRPG